MAMKSRIAFVVDESAAKTVAERANRLLSDTAPSGLNDSAISVQFLRNLSSQCVLALSSFHLLIATRADSLNRCTVQGFPGRVLQNQIHYSALSTISLACRMAFDTGRGMSGAAFGRINNSVLKRHSEHWSKHSNYSEEEAFRALIFLRAFFSMFSKTPNALHKQGTTLGRRIGFIKQYADRSAAHISIDYYEYDALDVAHLVAALALVGSIICSFDDGASDTYFNDVDEAAHTAALALFPDLSTTRLFQGMDVAMQARFCWQQDEVDGIQMLAEQLPYAIGWF